MRAMHSACGGDAHAFKTALPMYIPPNDRRKANFIIPDTLNKAAWGWNNQVVMCAPSSSFSHHHSKRAVLCVNMPYMIQRSLCVTNGHYCVTLMIQWPLWPSQTYWASWADIQLCCVGTRHSNLAIPHPCFNNKGHV
jgi:hypothetical protein